MFVAIFVQADTVSGTHVVVLNEAAARSSFGDDDAVGRTLLLGRFSVKVIGVASDTKYGNVREENRRIVYAPFGPDAQILVGSAANEPSTYAPPAAHPDSRITSHRSSARSTRMSRSTT